MKKILTLLLTALAISSFSQSDTDNCGFVPSAELLEPTKYTGTVRTDFVTNPPTVFNIFFHIVDDSSSSNTTTEQDILNTVAELNMNFNQFNIYYKYRGFDELTDNDYSVIDNLIEQDAMVQYYQDNSMYQNNAINVFLPISMFANNADWTTTDVFLSASRVQGLPHYIKKTHIHEFGHVFGLLHTFRNAGRVWTGNGWLDLSLTLEEITLNTPLSCDGNPPFSITEVKSPIFSNQDINLYPPENVTRDSQHQHYNADDEGDMVVDTYASFYDADDDCSNNGNYYYLYSDEVVDYLGEPYINCEVRNYMSYHAYKSEFTSGQGTRMLETIGEDYYGQYSQRTTTVSSLYEPYKGEYYNVGPSSENPPLFQWGFDYEFVECGDGTNEIYNQPSAYEDISFSYTNNSLNSIKDTDWGLSILHPNHSAIRIDQIDNTQPRKCYNNWNRNALGGSITKFNDGIINSNVTVSPKDSLQINNSNLIIDLNSGLYKIEKQYNDGSEEQNVIIKNDE